MRSTNLQLYTDVISVADVYRRAMRGKWVKDPCCPAAVIGEFVSMGNAEIAVSYGSAAFISASYMSLREILGRRKQTMIREPESLLMIRFIA